MTTVDWTLLAALAPAGTNTSLAA